MNINHKQVKHTTESMWTLFSRPLALQKFSSHAVSWWLWQDCGCQEDSSFLGFKRFVMDKVLEQRTIWRATKSMWYLFISTNQPSWQNALSKFLSLPELFISLNVITFLKLEGQKADFSIHEVIWRDKTAQNPSYKFSICAPLCFQMGTQSNL